MVRMPWTALARLAPWMTWSQPGGALTWCTGYRSINVGVREGEGGLERRALDATDERVRWIGAAVEAVAGELEAVLEVDEARSRDPRFSADAPEVVARDGVVAVETGGDELRVHGPHRGDGRLGHESAGDALHVRRSSRALQHEPVGRVGVDEHDPAIGRGDLALDRRDGEALEEPESGTKPRLGRRRRPVIEADVETSQDEMAHKTAELASLGAAPPPGSCGARKFVAARRAGLLPPSPGAAAWAALPSSSGRSRIDERSRASRGRRCRDPTPARARDDAGGLRAWRDVREHGQCLSPSGS